MSELRRDPILDRWVIIAPERSSRPTEPVAQHLSNEQIDDCPFCRGNEARTPVPSLTVNREGECVAGESDWLVRVVPNAYPAVRPAETGQQLPSEVTSDAEYFQSAPGAGVHEVIIESPEHVRSMTDFDVSQFGRIVTAWQTRLRQLSTREDLQHVSLFRNSGATAGGSVEHAHSQLLVTTFIPPQIEAELQSAAEFAKQGDGTIWTHLVRQELDAGIRIVCESDFFTVFCPFASRFAGEIWIVPRQARPDFFVADSSEIDDLARVLRDTLCRLDAAFGGPAFNLAVHTAPLRDHRRDAFHWHIEITPRLTGIAGFELSSGTWINVVAPEDAAARLRDASV